MPKLGSVYITSDRSSISAASVYVTHTTAHRYHNINLQVAKFFILHWPYCAYEKVANICDLTTRVSHKY